MNRKLIVVPVAALFALPALADTEVDRTIDASPRGEVEVSNVAGFIEIRGWSRDEVQVRGTLGDDVEELIFERDDDYVLIQVKVPRRHGRDIDSELYIKVPEGSDVEVAGVSADIDIDGVNGDQSLQTVSGDIETRGAASDLEVASVSGDVVAAGSGERNETEAGTVSGDLVLSGFNGWIEAGSVSGDITVTEGAFEGAEFETVNGDIEFSAALLDGGELAIESVNGTVDIEFADDLSARFDVETFNGDIRNCFGPKPERTSRYSPGLELSFTHGDGDGYVVIETLNGDIRICNE